MADLIIKLNIFPFPHFSFTYSFYGIKYINLASLCNFMHAKNVLLLWRTRLNSSRCRNCLFSWMLKGTKLRKKQLETLFRIYSECEKNQKLKENKCYLNKLELRPRWHLSFSIETSSISVACHIKCHWRI